MTGPSDVVARLAAALDRPRNPRLPIQLRLNEEDARELLRLARIADPWHVCTADGPASLPVPKRKDLPQIDSPDDPPFT